MKIIVDELPKICAECIFSKNGYLCTVGKERACSLILGNPCYKLKKEDDKHGE